jgi:hypothetical protein
MDHGAAVQLVTKVVEKYIQDRLEVNANLHERFGLDTPAGLKASRERARLREALAVIRQKPLMSEPA